MFTDYLLVDGYNVIFAQNKELYEDNIDAAREDLINKLCNFAGVNKVKVILVFDAYKVVGGEGSVEERSGIYIVYTKEAQTADSFIERTTHELSKNHTVTVATSDGLEQVIIMGKGALRMTAKELLAQLDMTRTEITRYIQKKKPVKNNMLVDNLDKNSADFLEKLRRTKN